MVSEKKFKRIYKQEVSRRVALLTNDAGELNLNIYAAEAIHEECLKFTLSNTRHQANLEELKVHTWPWFGEALRSAASNGSRWWSVNVSTPALLAESISQVTDNPEDSKEVLSRDPSSIPPPSPTTPIESDEEQETIDLLIKLAEMKYRGLLNEKEFKLVKQKLLE
jgi:hypothetical protein